jgi:flagellar protein FlaG
MDTPFMDPITKIFSSLSMPEKGTPVQTKPPRISRERKEADSDLQATMDQVSSQIQETLGMIDFKLNFSVDPDTQTVIAKVINAQTGKIIREIPPPELLALAKSMKEMEGLLFDEKI